MPRHAKHVAFAPVHRPVLRRWRLACSCGLISWRRCPDRRRPTPLGPLATPMIDPPGMPYPTNPVGPFPLPYRGVARGPATDATRILWINVACLTTPAQRLRGRGGRW